MSQNSFEILENRRMFSVSLTDGVLNVTGTEGNDVISINEVRSSASRLRVTDNGVLQSFALNQVTSIRVDARGGADLVSLDARISKFSLLRPTSIPATLSGGEGNDTIIGGRGDDDISGGRGNDSIGGGAAGNDTIWGQDGNDTIDGGAGNDELWGNSAPSPFRFIDKHFIDKTDFVGKILTNTDKIFTDADKILTNPGKILTKPAAGAGKLLVLPIFLQIDYDVMYGGAGNDSMHGNEGNDKMYGGANNDKIWGDAGSDNIYGETGNDNLFGGAESDNLYGGAGEDTLVSVGGGVDKLYGQENSDLFWKDDNVNETTDADLGETLFGNVQAIRSFANGVSKELNGQKLADPDATATTINYVPGPFGIQIPIPNVTVPVYNNFANVPLFGTKGPQVGDIAQGAAGDCFFLAAVAGEVQNGPSFKFKQRVVDFGDGTFGVNFRNANGENVYYRVDADLPVASAGSTTPYYAQTANNTLWVPIIEKAFAQFRTGANSYQSIWNGSVNVAFDALGMTRNGNLFDKNTSQMLLNIKAALAAGKVVTLATPSTAPPAGTAAVASHVYTVVSVTTMPIFTGTGYIEVPLNVIVRNPWGYDGPNPNRDATDGYVTFSVNQASYFTEALSATA